MANENDELMEFLELIGTNPNDAGSDDDHNSYCEKCGHRLSREEEKNCEEDCWDVICDYCAGRK